MDYNKADVYIGEQLYRERVIRRLTQEDMAKAISAKLKAKGKKKGISRQAYAFYEKGARSMPMDVFTFACETLSIDRNQLFNDAIDYLKFRPYSKQNED